MRAIHVFSVPIEGIGGESYAVPRLCEALLANEIDVRLAALDSPAQKPGYVTTFPIAPGLERLKCSPRMRRWLIDEAASGRAEIIHSHGLWLMPSMYSAWACQATPCRLVIAPHGTLAEWALRRHAMRKKLMWHLLQSSALRAATCWHATTASELHDIRRLGFGQPVCVLSHGVDIPPQAEKIQGCRPQLLFLGRIHEVKGVDILLRAWQALEHQFPDWDLRIVGTGDASYLRTIRNLAASLGLRRTTFPGSLSGAEKWRTYRESSLFVLPTRSENFGISVTEALACGTPVIVTKGAPWGDIETQQAGWWIDVGLDPLVACLEHALAMSQARLAEMGRAGRAWMIRDFSWLQIGAKWAQTYRWLLDGGDTPPWVQID